MSSAPPANATTLSGEPPAHASGHAPLPLKGELAKFHLTPREPDGRSSTPSYDVLLPNGIELAIGVDETDPIRRGEAQPPSAAAARRRIS